jgi:hypothetical protein
MVRAAHPVNSLWKPQISFRTQLGELASPKRYRNADGSCGASSEQPTEVTDIVVYSVGTFASPKRSGNEVVGPLASGKVA